MYSACATFDIADAANVVEGDSGTQTQMTFTVTKSGTGAANVNYAVTGGSATAGADFAALTPGTLVFGAGETTQTITVNVNGDSACEGSESIVIGLSGASNFAAIGDSEGVGTITNDEYVLPQHVLFRVSSLDR